MDIVDAFPVLEVMNIQVTSSNEELQYGIDESYSLSGMCNKWNHKRKLTTLKLVFQKQHWQPTLYMVRYEDWRPFRN